MKNKGKLAVALSGICCGKLGEIVGESKLNGYDWTVEFKFSKTSIERWDYKTNELEIINFL